MPEADAAFLLIRWRALRDAHDHAAAACARDIGMEPDQLPIMRDLQAQMDRLAAEMVEVPAASDGDLLAKLELWRLLAEAEETSEDPAETLIWPPPRCRSTRARPSSSSSRRGARSMVAAGQLLASSP